MEKSKETFCRLCSNTIIDENFEVIEENIINILDILLLKLDLRDGTKNVMCKACFLKLYEAFEFKSTCIDTDKDIIYFIYRKDVIPVDITDVYMNMRKKGTKLLNHVLEGQKVCRLCMEVLTNGFTPVDEVEIDMIQKCIPEVNFGITKDPVICKACLDSLIKHSCFIRDYFDLQEGPVNIPESQFEESTDMKTEVIEIKSEDEDEIKSEDEDEIKSEEIDMAVENETSFGKTEVNSWHIDGNLLKMETNPYDIQIKSEESEVESEDNKRERFRSPLPSEVNEASDLREREAPQKNHKELKIFVCGSCEFKTKCIDAIKSHMPVHTKTNNYKCNVCDIKFKEDSQFQKHLLSHKGCIKIRWYTCVSCGFKTKHKVNFKRHMMTHDGVSKVVWYGCGVCNFLSKCRMAWKSHVMTHITSKTNPKSQALKCGECSYKTVGRSNFILHNMMKHPNVDSTTIKNSDCVDCRDQAQCDICEYQTHCFSLLERHKLKHDVPTELLGFSCGSCKYKTYIKNKLDDHIKICENQPLEDEDQT